MWPGVIEAYRSYLPFDEDTPVITLNEGNTPLIHAVDVSADSSGVSEPPERNR